jgi:hypothetical protein
VVVLLLAHHDMFIAPHQPIHFARGYSWIPLFLLVAPLLTRFFERVSWRSFFGGAVLLLALSDNLIWLTVTAWRGHGALTVSADSKEALDWLEQNIHEQELLVCDNSALAYLGTVYSPIRAWHSHWANTPYADQREAELEAFFGEGTVPAEWDGKTALVLFDRTRRVEPQRLQVGDQLLLSNCRYVLVRRRFTRP